MIPRRIKRETGRYALVDGIPFQMPVHVKSSPALMVIYTIDADKAQALMPGDEIHALRLGRRALESRDGLTAFRRWASTEL